MAGPLLETKIHVPRLRRGLVARSRLSERLSRGAESALTLVSAPAGFGKTTLLTEWLAAAAAGGRSVAWLSLDQGDNEPARFWTYLVTALRSAEPGVGAGALALLQPPQAPIDAVLAALLNDLDAVSNDVELVLDDYHEIDARDVHDGMAFLLDHLPPHVHLVIASRTDPALPLPRLRARGELVEIRAADLRFTPEEAAAYLTETMGLALTAQDVAALEERTEGWIAALQLAALSMQGRDDVAAFIAGFAGDDRYIVDYLAEEVLLGQPEHVQQFLLQTSVLDHLTGPLCDAVTGQDGGKATLTTLERGNLFLVPLDDRRQWYRYHHLFADVLRAHLLDEQPELVPALHRRASQWYAENGEPSEAIRHALDARDFERAADLVERSIPAMRRTRQEASVHGWLKALPDEVVRARPVLSVGFAGAMLAVGEIEGVEGRLRDAERRLAATAAIGGEQQPPPAGTFADDEEVRRVPSMIELYRAALALSGGDGTSTVTHARRAVALAPEEDHLCRASAAGLSGLAHWAAGDLEAAHQSYTACVAGLHQAGHTADTLGCAIALADIRVTQGRLGEALLTFERALHLAPGHGGSVQRGTADMYVGMSEVLLERDDQPAASAALLRSHELGEHTGLPQHRYRSRVALARMRSAQGDLAGALGLLDEAERVYVSDFFPYVRPIPAMRARVHILRGELSEAFVWARGSALSIDDDLSYLREYEHITLARVLLAGGTTEGSEPALPEVVRYLARLLTAAEEGGRTGGVIELLVLQSLALRARGDGAAALVSLERAVTMAEPEGYVRVFADEGPAMASLLKGIAKLLPTSTYVRRLQAAITTTEPRPSGRQGLVEPLSERELDVLRLLRTDLDGPDIARALFVSLSTVRTHTQRIYAKLGVNNRRAAIRAADELNIWPGTGGG